MMFSSSKAKSFFLLLIFFIAVMVSFVLHLASDFKEAGSENLKSCFLLIMDFSFLNCPLCVQSLSNFISVVRANRGENSVFGILVFDREENKKDFEKHVRIIEKRLRGFIIGHDIKFPFFVDRNGSFHPLCPKASAVLVLFDAQKDRIKEYSFPLDRNELSEISQSLRSWGETHKIPCLFSNILSHLFTHKVIKKV